MAVSVDSVYQTVLTLLNKEQRGFLPQKEFNLLAQQAQVEIFENYFFELGRATAQYGEMTDEYSSIADNIFEKLEDFETSSSTQVTSGVFDLPSNMYRLQTITANGIEVIKKKHREIGYMLRSPLTSPNEAMPNYVRTGRSIQLYPSTLTSVVVNYIQGLSTQPTWEGMVVSGQVVVNPPNAQNDGAGGTSINFELHSSEEPELVSKILGYAGLVVKAQDVMAAATAMSQNIQQNEQ